MVDGSGGGGDVVGVGDNITNNYRSPRGDNNNNNNIHNKNNANNNNIDDDNVDNAAYWPESSPYYAYYDFDDELDLTSSGGLNLLVVAALVAGIIAFALCCTCLCTCCFSYGKDTGQGLSSEEVKRWNDQMRVIEPYCSSRLPEGGGPGGGGWGGLSPTGEGGGGRRSRTGSLYGGGGGGDDDGERGDNVSISNASSIGIGNGIGGKSGALNNNNSNNKKSGQKKGGASKSSKK